MCLCELPDMLSSDYCHYTGMWGTATIHLLDAVAVIDSGIEFIRNRGKVIRPFETNTLELHFE